MKYIAPTALGETFTCPHCHTVSKQDWWYTAWDGQRLRPDFAPLRIGYCHSCKQNTVWVKELLCYPDMTSAPPPNAEMPPDILKLYREAASISAKSPRGAAALLRLAIQMLCIHLGEPGKDINTDIGSLVKKGLPELVQQSLDIVRVTGNDAVHPGQIDTDDAEVVEHLFNLVNIIVENRIAEPKKITGLYQSLPANKLKGIENRDKPKP